MSKATPYQAERFALLEAARAGMRYHQAIEECGGDAARIVKYRSTGGRDLDSLYAEWQQANARALEMATGEG